MALVRRFLLVLLLFVLVFLLRLLLVVLQLVVVQFFLLEFLQLQPARGYQFLVELQQWVLGGLVDRQPFGKVRRIRLGLRPRARRLGPDD